MAYAQRETRGADADLCWLQLDAQMTTHTSRIYLYIYSFPIPFPLHTLFAFWPEFRSWRRLLSVDSDSVIDSGFVYGFCVSAFGALTWRQLGSVSQSHSQSPSPDPRPAHKKFAITSLFLFFRCSHCCEHYAYALWDSEICEPKADYTQATRLVNRG